MNKLITPALVLCMMAGLIFLTGCPKDPCEDVNCGEHGTCIENADGEAECDCDEGWEGENCEDSIIVPGKTGNLEILVKKKKNGKASNNYSCMAVLGYTREGMYFTNLTSGKVNGGSITKTKLKGYDSLVNSKVIIDTFYSIKGNGTDPGTGKDAGLIKIEGIDEGTYFLHVYDGAADKYVTQVTITEAADDDFVEAEVEPLGKIKIVVGQSSIIGSEIDSNLVHIYPPDNQDTLQHVLKKDVNEIPFDYLYAGRTGTRENENGDMQTGTFYLIDIPVRKVIAVAYNSQFAPKDGEQAFEYVEMRKNILQPKRVSFR